jgi:hypothetical protein
MKTKMQVEMEQIASYLRRGAARRLTSQIHDSGVAVEPGLNIVSGIVSVKRAPDARPLSLLGGPTKALGRSKISIPEYKRYSKPK